MGKKTHRIANEVRADILRRIKEEGVPVAQAAKEHGIHETTIYGWMGASVQGAPSWAEFTRIQKQNKLSAAQKRVEAGATGGGEQNRTRPFPRYGALLPVLRV